MFSLHSGLPQSDQQHLFFACMPRKFWFPISSSNLLQSPSLFHSILLQATHSVLLLCYGLNHPRTCNKVWPAGRPAMVSPVLPRHENEAKKIQGNQEIGMPWPSSTHSFSQFRMTRWNFPMAWMKISLTWMKSTRSIEIDKYAGHIYEWNFGKMDEIGKSANLRMKFGSMDWWLAIYMKLISQMIILLNGWNLARWMIVNNLNEIDKSDDYTT
jgi:hypothetical protein